MSLELLEKNYKETAMELKTTAIMRLYLLTSSEAKMNVRFGVSKQN